MARVADPNEQHVPPVYATEAQPFTTTVPNMAFQEISECEEMDRQVMIRTNESVAKDIHSLKEAFKNIQTIKGHEGLEYEDLCMHPDIELPVGYKVPKFSLFDGKGNPHAHLRSYCDKLIGVGILQPIQGNVPNPVPKWHDETKCCAYHSGIPEHDTENCYALRERIEALIKEGVIRLKGPASNENNNFLPDHDDANVNMITVDEEHNLEGTIVPPRRKEKVKSSAFVTPMIIVQLRAPSSRSTSSKVAVMAPSFLGKALSTNLRRKRCSFAKALFHLRVSHSSSTRHSGIKGGRCTNLVERFKSLFITEEEAGCSVIFEDYAKDSTIWDAEQEDDSGNWTCAPTLFLPETS
ncbi:hypothetical protein K7X08_016855 [Anisodus acutangulus]|uniref:Gag-pro-like protein n=1 Tax=Anisodus acutangulus TaxID=402998 RepID=A0A9Q1LTG1_9SOLA|nr:hypothetical protein K7X08_016855 [Anisodus acutangulus]